MSMSANKFQPWPVVKFLHDTRSGNMWLWALMLTCVAGLLLCIGLMLIDHRMLNGVNVWDKPAKFFLSFIVQFSTVGWALSFLPSAQRNARRVKVAVAAMSFAAWLEMAYMIFRASRAEASHYNDTSVFAQVMYGAMGLGALTLVGTAFFIGYLVWRNRKQSLMTLAAGLGLMLGMVLATFAGVYMSAQTSHWVGGEMSDVHGLGFFGWSTTGGDLRVAHFAGMHAAQFIPMAALIGNRRVVYGVAAAMTLVTAALFILGANGIPILRT